jgi:hypothetical protein
MADTTQIFAKLFLIQWDLTKFGKDYGNYGHKLSEASLFLSRDDFRYNHPYSTTFCGRSCIEFHGNLTRGLVAATSTQTDRGTDDILST